MRSEDPLPPGHDPGIKVTVKPSLPHNRRADRFRRRGHAACQAQWRLITTTHNLLKLFRVAPGTA
jgi:hypothetical protein